MVREVGKPAVEANGKVTPRDLDPRVLRAGLLCCGRLSVPAVTRRAAVHATEAARCRGTLSRQGTVRSRSGYGSRARARVRQRGATQAVVTGARMRRTARRDHRPNVSEDVFKVYGGGDAAEALLDSGDAVSFIGSDRMRSAVRSRPMPAPWASRGSARWEARTPRSCSTTPIPLTRVAIIASAAMGYAGQKCTATSA